METYYDVLGLNYKDSQREIKKAYFRLIRVHRPDKDAEKFKKIREAYEVLSDEISKKEYDERINMPEWVQKYLSLANEFRECGDLKTVINLYKEILEEYKVVRFVEIALGEVYMQNGNTQKAINLYKKILEKDKENLQIMEALAHAYSERGWINKSIEMCKYILEKDQDHKEEIYMMMASVYMINNKYYDVKKILLEMLDMPGVDLFNVYSFLVVNEHNLLSERSFFFYGLDGDAQKYNLKLVELLEKNGKINYDKIEMVINTIMISFQNKPDKAVEIIQSILDKIDDVKIKNKYEKSLDIMKERNIITKLDEDDRISECISNIIKAHFDLSRVDDYEEITWLEISLAENELSVIQNYRKYQKQFNILQKEYKMLYDVIENFINKIQFTKSRNKLKKELDKKVKNQEISKFNEFMSGWRNGFDDNEYDDDYSYDEIIEQHVRDEAKIGRNDKCPCGSGKKYKNCCMNK